MDSLTSVTKQVDQLTQYCKDSKFSEAKKTAIDLYPEGLKWVIPILRNERCSNPIGISLKLAQLISSENLQMEDKLRYHIAKACRLFTQCFVYQADAKDHPLYPDTQRTFIAHFSQVINNLSPEDVATRYELKCARAAIKTLDTSESVLRLYGAPAADMLAESSFSKAAVLIPKIVGDLPESWFPETSTLWWFAHALLLQDPGSFTLEAFYEKSANYQSVQKVAFGSLEMMHMLLELSSTPQKFQEAFLEESDDKPSIFTWIDIQASPDSAGQRIKKLIPQFIENKLSKSKLLRKCDPFWKVRYRAVEHLRSLYFSSIPEEKKTQILQKFAARIPQEKERLVAELLMKIHSELESHPEWKELVNSAVREIDVNLPKIEEHVEHLEETHPPSLLHAYGDDDIHCDESLPEEENSDLITLMLEKTRLQLEKDKLEYFSR